MLIVLYYNGDVRGRIGFETYIIRHKKEIAIIKLLDGVVINLERIEMLFNMIALKVRSSSAMSNEGEYFLAEGEAFLLPSNAIYRINNKLDDASDLSSVYSNEPESAIGDGLEADELYMDDTEFIRRLYKFGLDINGLPFRDDLLFETFDKAANFTLKVQELSWWQKFKGIKADQIQVPHVVLWDYFGGTSCLDINCTAGDQINVLCEEFQVREIDSMTSDGRTFLRLPMQWSLGRWIRNQSFQSHIGLIPSCWLIEKSFYDGGIYKI
ncbi:Pyruvate dehydrogenase E1 component [Dirofilaria immitis]